MAAINLTIPKTWSELSPEQVRTVAKFMNEHLTREELLFVLFCQFSGVRRTSGNDFVTSGGYTFRLEDWQLSDFCNRLAYIMDEMPFGIKCPVNVDDYIADVTFENYFHADALMIKFRKDNDAEIIKSVLQDLGDPRGEVSPILATEIMLWWSSLQNWLMQRYPNVFASSDGEPSSQSYHPWVARQNILLMLNNDRPQDNVAIEKSLAHDVLAALDHKIARMKEEESALNKIK